MAKTEKVSSHIIHSCKLCYRVTFDYNWNTHFQVCIDCIEDIPEYVTDLKQIRLYLKMRIAKKGK